MRVKRNLTLIVGLKRAASDFRPATNTNQAARLGEIQMKTAKTYSGDWKTDAHAINGEKGTHFDLAAWVQRKGFEVVADHEDNERSIIARPGPEDFGIREIGEIVGDAEAIVKIHADLS